MTIESSMTPAFLLISPLRDHQKHPANPLATKQRFLNFGALSLASYLNRRGWSSYVYDEYATTSGLDLTGELARVFSGHRPLLVGVSTISSYSADQTQQLLQSVKRHWPGIPTAIGGQHFVGYWENSFADRMPEADILVAAEAESALNDILSLLQNGRDLDSITADDLPANVFWKSNGTVRQGWRPAATRLPLDSLIDYDYSLYPGSDHLFPSIEFSRGCPYSCVFCANSRENRLGYRRASSNSVGDAIAKLVKSRTESPVEFYLQASNFSVTCDEAHSLASSIGSNGDRAHWRTEIRVDGIQEGALGILASAGLRVLDVGLESASAQILKLMQKCVSPSDYLARAEHTLREAADAGIFTKVNYLIHPGDTHATVEESWAWLRSQADKIGAVSSGVAIEYPGTPLSQALASYKAQFGTQRHPHPLSHWGVFNLQPSTSLSLEAANSLATAVAQSMQTKADFARSKSFGYLGGGVHARDILASLPEASHTTPYRD